IGQQTSMALDAVAGAELDHQRRSGLRFRALMAQSQSVVFMIDDALRISFATSNSMLLIGRDNDELLRTKIDDLLEPSAGAIGFQSQLTDLMAKGEPVVERDLRVVIPSGDSRWFSFTVHDRRREAEVAAVVVTARDIHDQRRSEQRVLRSEARFRSLVHRSSDIVAIFDDSGFYTYVSPAVERILGYEPAELVGTNVLETMSLEEVENTADLRSRLSDGSVAEESLTVRTAAKDGSWRYLNVKITNLLDDPSVEGFVMNVRDDTERLSLERDLRYQALHDPLTSLANRTQLSNALGDVLNDGGRVAELVGVVYIDLDEFKTINDGLGHAVGDQVLVAVGQRLHQAVRLHDLVARFGGDEFAIMLTRIYGEHEALQLADRIVRALTEPLAIEGRNVEIAASVGIAFDSGRTKSADEVIKQAEVAMYASKDAGGAKITLYDESMMSRAGERLDLIASLKKAIEVGEIDVHYQPIIELSTDRIVGFEALARWNHPERGLISPAGFIPLAEETGLIVPLGIQVLEKASAQLRRWVDDGHDIYVSVNVSAHQLQLPDIVTDILNTVEQQGLAPERVLLEMTESVFVSDKNTVADRIRRLRAAGFRIAIDDFGTGYSSLQYLQQFEFDVIKIDKSFVDRLDTDEDNGVIQTVLDLARKSSAKTVAEGIESAGQARALIDMSCDQGQGYYYARPMPAAETARALSSEPLPALRTTRNAA
ncbi:MAG: EAL domain-containing protein, partial [Acidimicrobiales bacterium]